MKVLVLSCSTGGGHNSCAKYIQSEFIKQNIECDFKDYMDIVGPKASAIAEKIYLDSTKGSGNIFKGVYKLGEIYNKTGIVSPVYGLNKLVKDKLFNLIEENKYDVVIGTHVFPCMALTALKKEKNVNFINVATDYECIPFWNETTPDTFVIPSELLKTRFVEKGIDPKVLLPIGIPVASSFFETNDSIDVPSDKPIVLLTSGSMGFGSIVEISQSILNNISCNLVVVCGSNKKLYDELEKIENDNLYVKGFINNINDYMAASTVILAKPGGLTTTEVVMMRKPLIHIMPIPGVENYNAEFFSSNKMSIKANTIDEIVSNLKELLSNESLRHELVSNQEKLINKNSARDLVEFVKENFSGGNKDE